jgi:hypothetical protein
MAPQVLYTVHTVAKHNTRNYSNFSLEYSTVPYTYLILV